jgi:hypothetical protein
MALIPPDSDILLFDRAYSLQIEDITVSGLNITFTVKRSLSAKVPGRCDISVFNLSSETRKHLHAMRDVFVSLEAGYATGKSVIYRGDLVESWSSREGTEWTTTITSDDGGKKRRTKRVQKNYLNGATLQTIIRDLAGALEVGLGNTDAIAPLAKFWKTKQAAVSKGFTASGDAVSQLDRIARSCGLSWSIQDGQLQFLVIGGATTDPPQLLTSDTGLIESPELGKDQIVKCRTLMIPGLYPGRVVELETRYTTGLYRIETATHQGESDSVHTWHVELELKALAR